MRAWGLRGALSRTVGGCLAFVERKGAGVSELNVYLKPNLTWGWRLREDAQRIIAIDGTSGYPDADRAFDVANRIVNGEYLCALRTRSL